MKDTPPKKAPNGQTEGERHKEGDASQGFPPKDGGGGPPTRRGCDPRIPCKDAPTGWGGCPPHERIPPLQAQTAAKNQRIPPLKAQNAKMEAPKAKMEAQKLK